MAENFLDNDVGLRSRRRAEPVQVLLGVGQSVDMIDPQPLHPARSHEFENEPVRICKDLLVFDTQPHQSRHLEEAPVAQMFRCVFPVCQPPMLGFVQAGNQLFVF